MKDITPRRALSLAESIGSFEASVGNLLGTTMFESSRVAESFPPLEEMGDTSDRASWKALYLAVARHAVKLLEEAT